MALHPTIVATGAFDNPTDPVVALMIADGDITQEEANAAVVKVRGQQPVPYCVILGEIPTQSAAEELCDKLDVEPYNAARRSAPKDHVIAAASDEFLAETMERSACLDLLDVMARYARAGATISLIP